MKKYLCIAVVFLMLVSTFGVTSTVFADDSLSYEQAVAYKAVIDDAIAKYGIYTYINKLYSGVDLIKLIDFDGNGTTELLIGVTEIFPDLSGDCFYEVYGYDNGAFMLTHTFCSNSMNLCFQLCFAECNGKVYAKTWFDSICDDTVYYGTVTDNKWITTEFYNRWSYSQCTKDFHTENPELAGSDVYAINEKQVPKDEYNKQISKFKAIDSEKANSLDKYGKSGTEKHSKKSKAL